MKTELFRNENCLFLLKTLLIVNFQLLIACALCAQNGITLSDFSADVGSGGAATTLTFDVRWDKNYTPAIWSDTAWVFADFNNAGTMTRLPLSGATLTAHSADAAATYVGVRQIDGNPHGVWVAGNARTAGAFSATVQLYTAATATADFPGLCVYAINYPPRGQYTAVDSIKFNGTPDFTVWLAHKNETGISSTVTWSRAQSGAGAYPVPAGSYVHSFTDASRAPGVITPAIFTLQASTDGYCEDFEGVRFWLSGTQRGVRYQLYKNDGAVDDILVGTGNPETFTNTYKEGAYTVKSVEEGSFRAVTMSGTHTIEKINRPATPVIGVSSAGTVCLNGTLTFYVISPVAGATYTWSAMDSAGLEIWRL
jgi:hypothetical protein